MKLGPSTRLGPSTGFHMYQNRFADLSDDISSSGPQVSGGSGLSRDNQQYNSNKYDNYSNNSNNNKGGNIQRQNSRENSRHRNDLNGPSRSFQANALSRQSSSGRDDRDRSNTSNMHSQSQIIGRRSQQAGVVAAAAAAPASESLPTFDPTVEPSDVELDKIRSLLKTLVEEYLTSNSSNPLPDFATDFKEQVNRQHRWITIREMHFISLDKKEPWRQAVSKICFHCLNSNDPLLLTVEEYNEALKKYFDAIVDIADDYPLIFDYIAVQLGETLHANFVTLKDLFSYSKNVIDAYNGGKMLVALLKHLLKHYGPLRVREIWAASGLEMKQFLGEDENVAEFIATNVSQRLQECPPKINVFSSFTELRIHNRQQKCGTGFIKTNGRI